MGRRLAALLFVFATAQMSAALPGHAETSSPAAETILAGAAVSLRKPLLQIAAHHESATGIRIRLMFGASSSLAAQARAGAPLDLLLSADAQITDALYAEGVVGAPRDFATNRLVIVLAEGSPPVKEPTDLLSASLRRHAVPQRFVPVGRYARAWLEGHGLLATLLPRIVQTEHASATLAAVELGSADVAIVYRTDARRARNARIAFEIPPEEHPAIRYAVAVVNQENSAAANAFLERLFTEAGRAAFAKAGFGPPRKRP